MGDWRDADNAAQGRKPYAAVQVVDNDWGRYVEWDVTPLPALRSTVERIGGSGAAPGYVLHCATSHRPSNEVKNSI